MNQPKNRGDVLLIPLGLHGHVTPFMHVASRIIQRGLTCTLRMEERGRWSFESYLKKYPVDDIDRFRVEWLPACEATGVLETLLHWERSGEAFFEKLLQAGALGVERPTCMIVDQFAGWTSEWATKLTIPRYLFVCSPATFAYWCSNFSSLIKKDRLLEKVHEDPILDLPGAPKIRLSDIPDRALSTPEVYTNSGDTYQDAAGILINTFYDLEASVIDHFHSQLKAARLDDRGLMRGLTKGGQKSQVLPIGPIALETGADVDPAGSAADSLCIRWLDSRARDSVLYIAFGSLRAFDLSEAQIRELASALEATRVSFLWVLIPPRDGDSGESVEVSRLLPPGFQERTKGQGLIHPYFAPQLKILSHPATGAFLTHIGWNSSLESIFRGVPLIAWPRHAEQRLCYRTLESAGVAVCIPYGKAGENILVQSPEREKLIRTWVMDGAGKTKLMHRALELQRQARTAVAAGGSSYQNFENFIQEIQP